MFMAFVEAATIIAHMRGLLPGSSIATMIESGSTVWELVKDIPDDVVKSDAGVKAIYDALDVSYPEQSEDEKTGVLDGLVERKPKCYGSVGTKLVVTA